MTIVTEFIAAELAKVTRVVATPEPPFGYGTDLSCDVDLTPAMDEVSGLVVLKQAIVRNITTPRGSLPDDANYGIDVRGYCNVGQTATALRALAGIIKNELLKDDRIDAVTATVTPSSDVKTLRIDLVVTPVDEQTGQFTLTLAATSADVVLIAEGRAVSTFATAAAVAAEVAAASLVSGGPGDRVPGS